MDPQFINIVIPVVELIYSLFSIVFCVLALFVLVYYIRRRYKLYKEINIIPKVLLIIESYRNHLKNLKIKCIINNFIIVILLMEITENLSQTHIFFLSAIKYFEKVPGFNFGSFREVQKKFALFYKSIYYSLVPVLSLLMDFLWLAYRKYEYKYTIIIWIWYIVIRVFVVCLMSVLQILSLFLLLIKQYSMNLLIPFLELSQLSI